MFFFPFFDCVRFFSISSCVYQPVLCVVTAAAAAVVRGKLNRPSRTLGLDRERERERESSVDIVQYIYISPSCDSELLLRQGREERVGHQTNSASELNRLIDRLIKKRSRKKKKKKKTKNSCPVYKR